MLNHLARPGMDLLHIFNLFWYLQFFHAEYFIYNSQVQDGKPNDSPASFRPISHLVHLEAAMSATFCLLFFLKSNSNLSPGQVNFHPSRSALDQMFYLNPFWMSLANPTLALRQFLLLLTSSKLLTYSDIVLSFKNLFRLASLLALFDGFNLFFLTGASMWFFKITKVASCLSGCSTRFRSWLCTFLSSNDLPSFVSCSLDATDLAICSTFTAAVEATQRVLI